MISSRVLTILWSTALFSALTACGGGGAPPPIVTNTNTSPAVVAVATNTPTTVVTQPPIIPPTTGGTSAPTCSFQNPDGAPKFTSITPDRATPSQLISITVSGENFTCATTALLTNGLTGIARENTSVSFVIDVTPRDYSAQVTIQIKASATGVQFGTATLDVGIFNSKMYSKTKLNDTGITSSNCVAESAPTAGLITVPCNDTRALALSAFQDGMLGRDATSATNDSLDGHLGFSFAKVTGGCVLDNVTGLMWDDRGDLGLYTTFGDGRSGEVSSLVDKVNGMALCGYNDWRLPTLHELMGIYAVAAVTTTNPTVSGLDKNYFKPISTIQYLTSSIYRSSFFRNPRSIYYNPDYGTSSGSRFPSEPSPARLVRDTPASVPATGLTEYSYAGDEVTDPLRRLIWKRCLEGMTWTGSTCINTPQSFTLANAFRRAVFKATAESKTWRVPNIAELTSLGDFSRIDPSINVTAFPGLPEDERRANGSSVGTWSSTPHREYGDTGFGAVTASVVSFWSNWFVTDESSSGAFDARAKLRLVRSY